jgi:hypothetical protein
MNKSVLPPAWRGPSHPGAAVDHADTELIGHRGWKGTGFLWGKKKGEEEIIDISSPPFLVLQKDNTKTRT